MSVTGNLEYLPQARYTIQTQRLPLSWWPRGGGEFRAESTDDTGWWALALTSMYEVTGGEAGFLDIAQLDEAYIWQYWSGGAGNRDGLCGGGVTWKVEPPRYHNAISNELYLVLSATLHNLVGGGGSSGYLDRALQEWTWFRESGMINAESLVNDGLTEDAATRTCKNNDAPTWTYNQGVVLAGLVELYKATGDAAYVNAARAIADAVVASPRLMPGGILMEPCVEMSEGCEPDRTAFKGIFMRQLAKLDVVLADRPYKAVIERNAQSMYDVARNAASGFYGGAWQGPFDNVTVGRQVSAVLLLVAALEV